MSPIELLVLALLIIGITALLLSEYTIIPRATRKRLQESDAMWLNHTKERHQQHEERRQQEFKEWLSMCGECRFQAKNTRGLNIHKARVHGRGK